MNRFYILRAVLASLVVVFVAQQAEAYHSKRKPHHRHASTHIAGCTYTNEGREVCSGPVANRAGAYDAAGNSAVPAQRAGAVDATGNRAYASADATIIGGRPAGCPRTYCGCGLRKHLGLSDVRLNLAANWARLFPRESAPRAGLAAVRSGHVMYIEAAAGNGQWLIRDYNSGGGLSRLHVRDVRGYAFVNPHGQVATR